jgi:glyoxylase-like metal-dependent hydrolase (beta-lactamase superfamily II)
MSSRLISIGSYKVFGLRDGFFSLDGGAMFGVVPKIIWEKLIPADESNRIQLGLNSILIETPDNKILVDTGIGDHLPEKYAKFYSPDRESGLSGELKKLGISPEDIQFVINTHLHFDHCGGNTSLGRDGSFHPAFPNAEYVIQKNEWETANNPRGRDKPSYIDHLFLPLQNENQLHLVDGEAEIIPGIKVCPAAGHTTGHQIVQVESEEEELYFLGDLIPTAFHVRLPYIMSYDLYPEKTFEIKEIFLQRAAANGWIAALNHDPYHFFGRIIKTDGQYSFEPFHPE